MDAAELKRRTFQFGVRVVNLVRALPKTVEARAVGAQLVRSGTAVGANYRASCKARSKAEFVAKVGIVEEETDESACWLEMIIATEMLKSSRVDPLLRESRELERIFGKSRVTASRSLKVAGGSSHRQLAIGSRQSDNRQ